MFQPTLQMVLVDNPFGSRVYKAIILGTKENRSRIASSRTLRPELWIQMQQQRVTIIACMEWQPDISQRRAVGRKIRTMGAHSTDTESAPLSLHLGPPPERWVCVAADPHPGKSTPAFRESRRSLSATDKKLGEWSSRVNCQSTKHTRNFLPRQPFSDKLILRGPSPADMQNICKLLNSLHEPLW
jgi:hypothetical protein